MPPSFSDREGLARGAPYVAGVELVVGHHDRVRAPRDRGGVVVGAAAREQDAARQASATGRRRRIGAPL